MSGARQAKRLVHEIVLDHLKATTGNRSVFEGALSTAVRDAKQQVLIGILGKMTIPKRYRQKVSRQLTDIYERVRANNQKETADLIVKLAKRLSRESRA